jgi:predicted nucleic acid-binding protein
MSAELFLDSNVLIYQLDPTDLRKQTIAERVVSTALAHDNACISWQVVQECLNTSLRKARVRLDSASALIWLDTVLTPLYTVEPSAALYRRAIALQTRWQFSFYDALIVAAALQAGCKRLLTEDLQNGQHIEGLQVVDPFA